MLYTTTLLNLFEIIIIIVPVLLTVAFVTVAERKTMASMQRRLGPNIVGYYGLLQAFADALKLLLKEYISPTQANMALFFLGPIITLIFSLLGYAVIPYAPGLGIFDFNIGILYMLAVSSLATYGILLAGWSANSKYAFLGSLRSTAQLISYELVLTSGILLVVFITGSLNLTVNVEMQRSVWLVAPLFPIFIIFFISAVAETNRAPFDLAEAESELVSGFMTEHSAVIFVFFFLAEYASIVLICIFMSLLFFGGYTVNFDTIVYVMNVLFYLFSNLFLVMNYILVNIWYLYMLVTDPLVDLTDHIISSENKNISGEILPVSIKYDYDYIYNYDNYSYYSSEIKSLLENCILENGIYSLVLAIKSFALIFVFIWVRASLPRIRYDQLMSFCWTVMLPIVFGFIIFLLCIMYVLKITPCTALFF